MKDILKVMEEDWDARAETDAPYFTNSEKDHWDLNEYFAQGMREAGLFVKDVVENWGLNAKGKRMLEIGCGIGRQTRGFSEMFEEVYAIDISANMITKAMELNSHLKNVKFIKSSGQDLKHFGDNYFDFVYCYGVFDHIPDKGIIGNYFKEIHRVLKIGGFFKIELYTRFFHRKHWFSRLVLSRSLFLLFLPYLIGY